MSDRILDTAYYESPLGSIELMASAQGLFSLLFVKTKKHNVTGNTVLTETARQLDEYFKGGRKTFDIPLDIEGTDFQKRVWNELLKIPYGKTISYLQLARNLGDEKAIRAAGTANGRNPIAIIIPCHRVIGSNGDLVGYGGGLDKKKYLLELEGAFIQKELWVTNYE